MTDLEKAGLRLEYNHDGAVAEIALNRPERRNAQSPALWAGLASLGRELPETVRVVVLKGEGPSFSAGLDVRAFTPEGIPGEGPALPRGIARPELVELIAVYQEGFRWLRDPRFTTIAAVHGHAIGAGFQLALSCDLRIAAEDVRFCMKEPALGLVPDLTGTKPLVDIVGLPRALEICLTARNIGAEEARELGLVERVAKSGELDDAVNELVTSLLAVDAGAARATKALLQQAPANSLDEQCAAERVAQSFRLVP
ncbi:enoyl-CoA hydratase/isomerase family protein [Actinocorallia sp. API 0066]|uniref:enoyl-CoA hydratase/isomerase family protein n=1 Tax=Actinocorallia sp. API 0066 TaxID=2896846 RepID=UPI001E364B82|nr:enoyl-CoA hydratase/isomerase family protein [Actinocorallia sp. API 0066]MCD0453378.1 enoyl-CoA hydratase/isomerase family protein [Actinocorallia sp. API 0066]